MDGRRDHHRRGFALCVHELPTTPRPCLAILDNLHSAFLPAVFAHLLLLLLGARHSNLLRYSSSDRSNASGAIGHIGGETQTSAGTVATRAPKRDHATAHPVATTPKRPGKGDGWELEPPPAIQTRRNNRTERDGRCRRSTKASGHDCQTWR